jgi:hypothetical protein
MHSRTTVKCLMGRIPPIRAGVYHVWHFILVEIQLAPAFFITLYQRQESDALNGKKW